MDQHRGAAAFAVAERSIIAPPESVWEVLSDVSAWPLWHPGIRQVGMTGPLAPGAEFTWSSGGVRIRSTVETMEPPATLRWRGKATFGVTAVHDWELQRIGSDTRVVTSESFHGLLTKLMPKTMTRMLQQSLDVFLDHLKQRCEAGR